MSLQDGYNGRAIFISYRHLDNHLPPQSSKELLGFVDYLRRQVDFDLVQLGCPNVIFWQDRTKIAPADDFNAEIEKALKNADLFIAILSQHYITSPWCIRELGTMKSRVTSLGTPEGDGRIFRVDKHKISEEEIPEQLRNTHRVPFYHEDRYDGKVLHYFWRGKVQHIDEYESAVRTLAEGICERLKKLGIRFHPKKELNPGEPHKGPSNGRTVFVAKPAGDMIPSYQYLVRELQGAGYRVTPDPEKDLDNLVKEMQSHFVEALSEAEASIHLLGTWTGGRPYRLEMDLVPMQLAAAAKEAERKPEFKRIIWAPAILPGTLGESEIVSRDYLEVLKHFGQKLSETDQVLNDTAAHFVGFVLQHLAKERGDPIPDSRIKSKIVYIRASGLKKLALQIARELRRIGFDPIELARVDEEFPDQGPHIVACWGSQSKAKIEAEIRAIYESMKKGRPSGGKLILLLTSPSTKSKTDVLDLPMPYVDHIVDARKCDDARSVGEELASALGDDYGLLGGAGR
jgi:hypothetical protein